MLGGRLGVLLAALLAVPVLMVAAAPAHACSCAIAGVHRHLQQADVVFEGTITEQRRTDYRTVMRIEVARVYKGEVRERMDVETGNGGGDCGLGIPEGRRVLVFGEIYEGVLGTSTCAGSGTDVHRAHPELAVWRDPLPGALVSNSWGAEGDPGGGTVWWLVGGAVLLVGGAVYGVRRRGRWSA